MTRETAMSDAPERHPAVALFVASGISAVGVAIVLGGVAVKLLQIRRRRRLEQIRSLPVLAPLNLARLPLTSATAAPEASRDESSQAQGLGNHVL